MEMLTTMTQRGQVTVPAKIRRMLGLKPKDRVAFEIVDGTVIVRRPRYTLEAVAGRFMPKRPVADVDRAIREAKEEHAQRSMRKLRRK
jgi:AbrB family looped-hinge helix DNA binding protein